MAYLINIWRLYTIDNIHPLKTMFISKDTNFQIHLYAMFCTLLVEINLFKLTSTKQSVARAT